jgi:hypothetical protein
VEREHLPLGFLFLLVFVGIPLVLLAVTPGWTVPVSTLEVRAVMGASGLAMSLVALFDATLLAGVRRLGKVFVE